MLAVPLYRGYITSADDAVVIDYINEMSLELRTYSATDEPKDPCVYMTEETSCALPNTFCVTDYRNRVDGSRTLVKRCGDFSDAYNHWYKGAQITTGVALCLMRIFRVWTSSAHSPVLARIAISS